MKNRIVRVYDADDVQLANTTPRNAKIWIREGRAELITKTPFSVRLVGVHTDRREILADYDSGIE